MIKGISRKIINGIKFIIPMQIYLRYYEKKHSDVYYKLMEEVEASEKYKNDPAVKRDYFECLGKYGLPVRYYKEMGFYEIKDKRQRDSYVVPGKLMATWHSINRGPSSICLDDKVTYLKTFSDYINREWLDATRSSFNDFKSFCKKHRKMIVKNPGGHGGVGTHIFEYCNQSDEELNDILVSYADSGCVIEEYIYQNGILHDINPATVNCCRVCTMRFKDHVEVFQCFVTMGASSDVCVDNAYKGGLFAPIDVDTGVILRDPVDDLWHPYPEHPVSGIKLKGEKVPHWNKIKEMVLRAADKVSDIIYISWDVCISEDGSIYLIEGNTCGDGMWLKDGGEWEVYWRAIRNNHLTWKYKIAYNNIVKYHILELMYYLHSYEEVYDG